MTKHGVLFFYARKSFQKKRKEKKKKKEIKKENRLFKKRYKEEVLKRTLFAEVKDVLKRLSRKTLNNVGIEGGNFD